MTGPAELGALVVPFPDLDEALVPHLTGTTAGIGPHVTIAVPFPAVLTDAGVEALGEIAAAFTAWDVELAETAWFRAPHEVLWLRPEPAQPYHELAAAIAEVFELEIYGGPGVFTPHVTIGVGAAADLAAVEEAVRTLLPLRATAAELQLVQVADGLARAARSWPFGR